MFLLDLFRFCESRRSFDRQDLAKYIFTHRESERLARASGVNVRSFASSVSKEFLSRNCTLGYLDLDKGIAHCRGSEMRPFDFELRTLNGPDDDYIFMMNNIGEMDDSEIFGE